ncbi:PREDICTED: regulatory solute carrier protein family 1 member 1-like [Chrysochloris asiatica]|uniref:Regulatory solute carrier protein family 1 member 1 n=1 Tax=Chrysochloris asiatica TaxID=185453 RepID=A0A9B0TRP9_CHRAS|nr:PREDICTED: regulatory solute carrier protein family 1 member 1 [Chrysochloris asiatica]XP_006878140.1 PREDICTED: regulatory solute carrier protein family 1 member 1-like [Chrysochloris asiatica]
MSSLPASDGYNHLAHPSGQSPEIGNPTSFARSASASVCPVKPSDPDSLEPKAVKALKASAEFQITSDTRAHLLPLQDLSDYASSTDSAPAGQSPDRPLQSSSEEADVADTLKKSPAEKSTQGLKFHLYTRQETNLSVTTTRMRESQMLLSEKGWHLEYQNLSPVNGLQQHEEEHEQHEVLQQNSPRDQEHVSNTGDLELPGERQKNQQKCVGLEAEMKGDRLQQNVDLLDTERNILPSGCFGCSNSETLMEIDIVEQSLVAVFNSEGGQNTSVKNTGASDLTLDNPLMEVETSKCNLSNEILINSISTEDIQLPGSDVKMSGTNKEYGDCSSSLSVCGSCQSSVESTEESYSSVTTALQELHELLVSSSNTASESVSEEVSCQSETRVEGQMSTKDFSERWSQTEPLPAIQDAQAPQVSSPQAVPVPVKAEQCTGSSPGAGREELETTDFRGTSDGTPTHTEDVPQSRESFKESHSIPLASANQSNQPYSTLGAAMSSRLLGEEDALNQTSEQTKSLPSSFILVKDLGQGIRDPMTDSPETRENVCPEAASLFLEFDPPYSYPSSPSVLPPLIFPAADIDRILRAGFTLQEALGALHRVGGNADLALLVLLAKNIVVPT